MANYLTNSYQLFKHDDNGGGGGRSDDEDDDFKLENDFDDNNNNNDINNEEDVEDDDDDDNDDDDDDDSLDFETLITNEFKKNENYSRVKSSEFKQQQLLDKSSSQQQQALMLNNNDLTTFKDNSSNGSFIDTTISIPSPFTTNQLILNNKLLMLKNVQDVDFLGEYNQNRKRLCLIYEKYLAENECSIDQNGMFLSKNIKFTKALQRKLTNLHQLLNTFNVNDKQLLIQANNNKNNNKSIVDGEKMFYNIEEYKRKLLRMLRSIIERICIDTVIVEPTCLFNCASINLLNKPNINGNCCGSSSANQSLTTSTNPTSKLWSEIRARGCQFLGPQMQDDVLQLILHLLKIVERVSRKTLVTYVVYRLKKTYAKASRTSVGHVVQLLYRAGCFKVEKREKLSSLMELKREYLNYEQLRKQHDTQIISIALEAGIRMSPEQWSQKLYGDSKNKSKMQSIIDRLQSQQTLKKQIEDFLKKLDSTDEQIQQLLMSIPSTLTAFLISSTQQQQQQQQQVLIHSQLNAFRHNLKIFYDIKADLNMFSNMNEIVYDTNNNNTKLTSPAMSVNNDVDDHDEKLTRKKNEKFRLDSDENVDDVDEFIESNGNDDDNETDGDGDSHAKVQAQHYYYTSWDYIYECMQSCLNILKTSVDYTLQNNNFQQFKINYNLNMSKTFNGGGGVGVSGVGGGGLGMSNKINKKQVISTRTNKIKSPSSSEASISSPSNCSSSSNYTSTLTSSSSSSTTLVNSLVTNIASLNTIAAIASPNTAITTPTTAITTTTTTTSTSTYVPSSSNYNNKNNLINKFNVNAKQFNNNNNSNNNRVFNNINNKNNIKHSNNNNMMIMMMNQQHLNNNNNKSNNNPNHDIDELNNNNNNQQFIRQNQLIQSLNNLNLQNQFQYLLKQQQQQHNQIQQQNYDQANKYFNTINNFQFNPNSLNTNNSYFNTQSFLNQLQMPQNENLCLSSPCSTFSSSPHVVAQQNSQYQLQQQHSQAQPQQQQLFNNLFFNNFKPNYNDFNKK